MYPMKNHQSKPVGGNGKVYLEKFMGLEQKTRTYTPSYPYALVSVNSRSRRHQSMTSTWGHYRWDTSVGVGWEGNP